MKRINIINAVIVLVLGIITHINAQNFPVNIWQSIGPNGGQIWGLIKDDQVPTTLYAVVDTGFVYKTVDAGNTWNIFPNLGGYKYFEALCVSPHNSNLMFAQALIVDGWRRPNLRSTNGGTDWNLIQYLPSIFHPTNADTIFAINMDSLKISINGGATWVDYSKLPSYPAYSGTIALLVNTNPNIMLLRDGSDTLRRSTDMGKTWSKIVAKPGGGFLQAKSIAQRANSYKHIYAMNSSYSGGFDLYISRDEGLNWQILANNPLGTSFMAKDLFIAPSDTSTLWLLIQDVVTGNPFLIKSTNQGQTWTYIPKNLPQYSSPTIVFVNDNNVLLLEEYFISKTTDGGLNWEEITDGIVAHIAENIIVHPIASALLFNPSYSPYLYRVEPNNEWTMQEIQYQIASVKATPSNSNKFYLIPQKLDTLLVSTDAAKSWTKVSTGFSNMYVTATTFEGLQNISIDPNNDNIIFFNDVNNKRLYRSTNGGANWDKISDSLTQGIVVANGNSSIVYGMISLPKNYPTSMYPRKSTNGGLTWSTIMSGFPQIPSQYNDQMFLATSLVINPDNPNIAFIGGVLRKSGSYDSVRVFKTTDGGTSWNIAQNGLPEKFNEVGKILNKVVISPNPFNALEYVLIIPESGIYLTSDGGDNWVQLPSPVNRAPLNALIGRDAKNEVLLVGFHAGSIYAYKLREAPNSVEQKDRNYPESFQLFQNYPNPFNPSTVISYQLSVVSNVKISIYDLLGREVAVLVDGVKPAGLHQVEWDASGFTSGIYFCKMQAGKFTNSIKLLLTK